ncbi:unnamed protein product [Cutaneotrichosporon oleaginosum]
MRPQLVPSLGANDHAHRAEDVECRRSDRSPMGPHAFVGLGGLRRKLASQGRPRVADVHAVDVGGAEN